MKSHLSKAVIYINVEIEACTLDFVNKGAAIHRILCLFYVTSVIVNFHICCF